MKVNSNTVILGLAGYTVGVYVLQRFVLKRMLPIPGFLDPLGALLGYPADVTHAAVNTPAAAAPTHFLPAAPPVVTDYASGTTTYYGS